MAQKKQVQIVWFSQLFGLDLPQFELPFVDFNIYSDVPLYIDPYAITKDPTDLAAHSHNAIISYFQELIDAIRSKNNFRLRRLVRRHLSEPSEIHLGVGRVARQGRGIGPEQELWITKALASSEAARVGAIESIQELELHIPGIGPDKVSDLVANIILVYLAQFTEEVCSTYGIATRPCALSGYWNQGSKEWDGGYFNLPVYGTHSYVLVPRRFVRREPDLMNHRQFYRKYILEVLQRDLLDANDSLVQTLKNGQRRVTKKSIQEDLRFPFTKEFISQYIIEHPEVIEVYRENLAESFRPVDAAVWSGKYEEDDVRVNDLLSRLDGLTPGNLHARTYEDTVFALVEFIFDWALENFEMEYQMDQGRSRIDVIADNYASGGLFEQLRQDLNATSVPMECKNYGSDLGNNEFNQLLERLSATTSRFGILFCRTIDNNAAMLKHQTDRWLRHNSLMLLFDDDLLGQLVQLRLRREFSEIERVLRRMIRAVKFGASSPS